MVAVTPREHAEWLDAVEELAPRGPDSEPWLLQHAFWLTPAEAARYRRNGFDVTTSMSFCWGKGDLYAERLGEEQFRGFIPLRTILDAGMNLGCGSDWGPKNVFEHLWLAMTHTFAGSGRTNRGPAQRVSREEALAMWTTGAAATLRWPGVGSLAPGSHADIAVVDRDPVTCDLDELPEGQVVATLLGGSMVHGGKAGGDLL